MASEVEICNRALQKIGARRIVSLTEDSVNGRACNFAYKPARDAELRAHPWNFAIKRAELAADATAPSFGRANSFTLPSDYLRLLPPYPEDNLNTLDWQIEGRSILTDDSAPLQIRYIGIVTDPNKMDTLFREALSAKLAFDLTEELSQSNTKKEFLMLDYEKSILRAKRINAILNVSASPPEDEYITVRI